MTDEPTARDLYEARVRHRIARLPRFGYGNRDDAARAIIELGDIYAEHVARTASQGHRAAAIRLRERYDGCDESLARLNVENDLITAERDQARAEAVELNRQVAERTAERDDLVSRLNSAEALIRGYADLDDQRTVKINALTAERDKLREMITAKPNGIVHIDGDLTPEAAAAVKIRQLPDGCRCIWTLRLPEGEFVRSAPDPGCTADHDEPAPAPATQAPAPAAVRPRASRAKAPAGQGKAGRSESLPGPQTVGTGESGFSE